MVQKSCLYWIRHISHDDMFTQGYIGVSKYGMAKRLREHYFDASRGSSNTVHKAMRKYGEGIVATEILRADPEYCLEVERKLRPSPGIGWNICAGGSAPQLGRALTQFQKDCVSRAQKGRPRTDDERRKVSEKSKGRKPSEEARRKMSERAKARGFTEEHKRNISIAKRGIATAPKMYKSPKSIAEVWLKADEAYEMWMSGLRGSYLAKSICETFDRVKTLEKHFNAGWNPKDDIDFRKWKLSAIR